MKSLNTVMILALATIGHFAQISFAADGPTPEPAAVQAPAPSTAPEPQQNRGNRPFKFEFWLNRRYEPGVENRVLAEYLGRFQFNDNFDYLLGGSLSFFDQWGISTIGLGGVYKIPKLFSEITLTVQQQRWPNWRISENRIILYWSFSPNSRLHFSVGYSYRAPQYSANFIQSLGWPTDMSEFGPVYRSEIQVVQYKQLKISVLGFNYDRMKLATWTNIHFAINPVYQLNERCDLQLLAAIAVKGFSGAIVSWDQNSISVGFSLHD